MSESDSTERAIGLERVERFELLVDFGADGVPRLRVDESPPLGGGNGPSPTQLLASAVGSCLASSLLFCLSKSHADARGLRARVAWTLARSDKGRLRIGGLRVTLAPAVGEEDRGKLERCAGLFEDFCTVTQSIRAGIPVEVVVER